MAVVGILLRPLHEKPSGATIPKATTISSKTPQPFSQALSTRPSDTTTAMNTSNSSAMTQVSMRCRSARPGMVRADLCATNVINAADVDAADTTNSIPSNGVSAQIGRL